MDFLAIRNRSPSDKLLHYLVSNKNPPFIYTEWGEGGHLRLGAQQKFFDVLYWTTVMFYTTVMSYGSTDRCKHDVNVWSYPLLLCVFNGCIKWASLILFAIYGGGAENVAVENIQHGRKSRAGKCGSRNSERVWKARIVLCSVLKQLIACTYFMAHVHALSPSYMYLLQPAGLLFGAPC